MAFKITGILDETVLESIWIVTVYDLLTGDKEAEQQITTQQFSINVPNGKPKRVVVEPRRFGVWKAQTAVSINDRIYPTNPVSTPYYYRCITAGTTGNTEPVWGIGDSATVNDGSAVWILVERIIQPVCHSPVIPESV